MVENADDHGLILRRPIEIKCNAMVKVLGFYGTSKDATLMQIWIAMCVNLLIALLKFQWKLAS
ncbi:hypothetical protein AB833_31375 [Chromatiales bacterium (ex Bugula neritina AB1)]|nr:hypothetical protein AB833_31375 [Chromatiales bacterium (ex Bugula neritina AB1)]